MVSPKTLPPCSTEIAKFARKFAIPCGHACFAAMELLISRKQERG
jgi:hypothetical protein